MIITKQLYRIKFLLRKINSNLTQLQLYEKNLLLESLDPFVPWHLD